MLLLLECTGQVLSTVSVRNLNTGYWGSFFWGMFLRPGSFLLMRFKKFPHTKRRPFYYVSIMFL